MTLPQILLILVGLFTVAGGVFGWEWFIGHWKSRLFVKMLGYNGTRVFYIIFGIIIVGAGYFWL